MEKSRYKGPVAVVVSLVLIFTIFAPSLSQAATSTPTASMCKTLMPTLKAVYNKNEYSILSGFESTEMIRIRNIWKTQSNKLSKGSTKSQLDTLIDEMYGYINLRPGSAIFWNDYIYKIAATCTPPSSNAFCRTWKSSLTTVLLGGITGNVKVSELVAIRKIWATQASKIPMGPTKIAFDKTVLDLDELISETKRKRVSLNVSSALSADIDVLMSDPDGYWPCSIDPVLNALGAVDPSDLNKVHPTEICYEVYSWNNRSDLKLACSTYPNFEWKDICTKYPYMSLRQIESSGYTVSTLKNTQGNYYFAGKISDECDAAFPYEHDARATTYLSLGRHQFYIDGFNSPPTLAEVQAGGLHAGANQWVWTITVK
jgi:hypothetical protein